MGAWSPDSILDVATGSGDLALALKRRIPAARVVGTDFCQPMLLRAQEKGLEEVVLADALSLPFPDGAFDVVTVAFGLRNMTCWPLALREMRRVLRDGGHILVLDFSIPPPPLRAAYRFYLHRCLPLLAGLVTGERDAYRYLGDSIERFPSGAQMRALLDQCGYKDPTAEPKTGGIVSIYTGKAG